MNINEVIKFITETPNNTNPNVLRSVLETFQESGGSSNGGSETDSEIKVVTLTIVVDSAEENASGSFNVDTTLGTTEITQGFECFVSDAFRIILCDDSGYFSYDTDCITIESYTGGILYDADENTYTITGDATIHVTLLDNGSYI